MSQEEGYSGEASSHANQPALKSQQGKDKGGPEGAWGGGDSDKISNKAASSKWQREALC